MPLLRAQQHCWHRLILSADAAAAGKLPRRCALVSGAGERRRLRTRRGGGREGRPRVQRTRGFRRRGCGCGDHLSFCWGNVRGGRGGRLPLDADRNGLVISTAAHLKPRHAEHPIGQIDHEGGGRRRLLAECDELPHAPRGRAPRLRAGEKGGGGQVLEPSAGDAALNRHHAPAQPLLAVARPPPRLRDARLRAVVHEGESHVGEAVVRAELRGAEGADGEALSPEPLQTLAVIGVVCPSADAVRPAEFVHLSHVPKGVLPAAAHPAEAVAVPPLRDRADAVQGGEVGETQVAAAHRERVEVAAEQPDEQADEDEHGGERADPRGHVGERDHLAAAPEEHARVESDEHHRSRPRGEPEDGPAEHGDDGGEGDVQRDHVD
mmetsp:Transcript_27266/g.62544  ORF Transcript_27266/g.62544 Transcript_27266/m.62544 type:complete len:379 (-) Transcript_27266:623-1759(-)